MFLHVTREGCKVRLDVPLVGWTFHFWFDAVYEWAAEMVVRQYREFLVEKYDEVYKSAYQQGWADAKAKRAKQY